MNATVLDFPTLDTGDITATTASTLVPAKVDLQALALTRFGDWRTKAKALVDEFATATFDPTTPKGYKALTEAISTVRAPRFAAQNVSEASKSELAKVSKSIGAEKDSVVAFLKPTEDRLVAIKDAHDAKVKADAAEAARIEAERVAKHQANLVIVRGYVEQARGKTSAQIGLGIKALEAMSFGDEWQEFKERATFAAHDARDALIELRDAAKAREDEAARIEAQRIENARVAAELAAERQRLADQAEAQRRSQEAIDAAKDLAAAIAAAAQPKGLAGAARGPETAEETTQRGAADNGAGDDAKRDGGPASPGGSNAPESVLLPAAAGTYASSEAESAQASPSGEGEGAHADQCALEPDLRAAIDSGWQAIARRRSTPPGTYGAPAAPVPTLNLGKICDRLGFIIGAELLGTLGYVATRDKQARLFHESDWSAMCAAIAEHVLKAGEKFQGAKP